MESEMPEAGYVYPAPAEKLDKIDTKLISCLMKNCRLQLSTLARIIGISKNGVMNRINRLQQIGVVNNFQTYIHVPKLAYNSSIIMLKTSLTLVEEVEYLKYVARMPYIMNALNTTGSHNFFIYFYYCDFDHFNRIVSNILKRSNARDFLILNTHRFIFTELSMTDIDVDIDASVKKEDYSYQKLFRQRGNEKVKIDGKDIDLLYLLANNSRATLTELAMKLGLNRETVNYRLKKLVKGNIIAKFQPNVNPYSLGHHAYLIKIKLINREKSGEVIRFIATTKKANDILELYESWSIMAFMHYDSVSKLQAFENELVERFGNDMLEYDIDFIKRQSKLDWFPKEVADDIKKNLGKAT
jgi:Lrp/AsnC family leucine-responsive transcriptional regulator